MRDRILDIIASSAYVCYLAHFLQRLKKKEKCARIPIIKKDAKCVPELGLKNLSPCDFF